METLYQKSKTGAIVQWTIWAEDNKIYTEWGQVGGKLQTAIETAVPMNEGNSNFRSASQQAQFQAENEWNKRIRSKKYSTNPNGVVEILPMLAHEFREKDAVFPGYVQVKLDGNRCMALWDGKVTLRSRGGQEWTVPDHINEELRVCFYSNPDYANTVLDGELYIHGIPFEEFSSYVKKKQPGTEKIEYHIYDCYVTDRPEMNFHDRLIHLFLNILPSPFIRIVETNICNDRESVWEWERKYVDAGYEGAIFRNIEGRYLLGKRSRDLMKLKTFQDAEFKILDIRQGKGNYEGKPVFLCQNDISDATFESDMNGTANYRTELYNKKQELIGNLLTVKFFGRTEAGIQDFLKE